MSPMMTVLSSFAAGALGSALGALTSIVLCALVALAGIAANLAGSDLNLVNDVTFGLLLGPHVSFAPACCALCYAWKRGYLADSKDSSVPLISLNHADALLVGGLFGVAGWYLNAGLSRLAGDSIDSVALTVVLLSLAAKWIFGGSPIGRLEPGERRLGPGSRPWLSTQAPGQGFNLLTLSVIVSLLGGGITLHFHSMAAETGNPRIAAVATLFMWALGLIQLLFLGERLNVPIFHHIGLCSAVGAQMAIKAGSSDYTAILWALALGITAAYLADLLGRLLHIHGPGYVDPPSAAIAVASPLALGIFPALGVDRPGTVWNLAVPILLIALFLVYELHLRLRIERRMNP